MPYSRQRQEDTMTTQVGGLHRTDPRAASADPATAKREQARRNELNRRVKAASFLGLSVEAHAAERDKLATLWLEWFRSELDKRGLSDPVQTLPEAFAQLELHLTAHVARELNKLKAHLRKAVIS
jgi:hypothetical protein